MARNYPTQTDAVGAEIPEQRHGDFRFTITQDSLDALPRDQFDQAWDAIGKAVRALYPYDSRERAGELYLGSAELHGDG